MYPSAIAFGHINGEMSAIQQGDTATHRSRGLFSLVIHSCADPLQSEPSSGWLLASFSRMGGKEAANSCKRKCRYLFVQIRKSWTFCQLWGFRRGTWCHVLRVAERVPVVLGAVLCLGQTIKYKAFLLNADMLCTSIWGLCWCNFL